MIKRQESSSNAVPLPPSSAASPDADHNGKDKRHGGMLDAVQRLMSRNGKYMVMCGTALILSVFLIPPLKVVLNTTTAPAASVTTTHVGSVSVSGLVAKTKKSSSPPPLQIPPCPSSPWKEHENLRGKCPGDLKPNKDAATMSQCASTCCSDADCVSWQFRQDVGCLQGKDVRLGMEKDGVAAWCSDHPPHRWEGQYLKPHGNRNKGVDAKTVREGACDTRTWNPNEEIGQCFGLGDVQKDASGSAEECMRACCNKEDCGAWQWNKELGCFYGKGMHSCQGKGDPIAFEPFVGRRKRIDSRKYTDKHNKPWQMTMA